MLPQQHHSPDDMPAPRLYALFAKANERAICVVSRNGSFCGIVSRVGLIRAARRGPSGEVLRRMVL